MLIAAKYRLYPTKDQKELLTKHFGCVRLIYNLALETRTCAWTSRKINLSRFELSVQLKELKQTCEWLREVNSQSLQAALLHLERAYTNFFGKTGRFPRFKSKHHKQSFHCPQYVQIENGKLLIPKFREGIRLVCIESIEERSAAPPSAGPPQESTT